MKVGRHEFEVEEPDLIVLRARGEILPADADVLAGLFAARVRGGRLFILSFVLDRGEVVMGAESRKTFIEALRGVPVVVNAVVGADFRTRVIGRLVETAARVLASIELRLGFHDDEPLARAWLREQGCIACGATSGPDRKKP